LNFSIEDKTNEDLLLEKAISVENNPNDFLAFKVFCFMSLFFY